MSFTELKSKQYSSHFIRDSIALFLFMLLSSSPQIAVEIVVDENRHFRLSEREVGFQFCKRHVSLLGDLFRSKTTKKLDEGTFHGAFTIDGAAGAPREEHREEHDSTMGAWGVPTVRAPYYEC